MEMTGPGKLARITIMLSLCLLLVACNRHKDDFVLEGTVAPGVGDTILVTGIDSRFARIDTIVCKDGGLKWAFTPDTTTMVVLCLKDGRMQPILAEKSTKTLIDIPVAGTGEIEVTGSEYNRILQEFRRDSYSDQFQFQTLGRLDSLIGADPFSPILPYLLYEYGVNRYHASTSDLNKLINRMSGSIQDDPLITDLKSRFPKTDRKTAYFNDLLVTDTARAIVPFDNFAKGVYKLVCVWASYDAQSLKGRQTMKEIIEKYKDDEIEFADISIDTNFDRWINTLQESDTIEMTSFCDMTGWNSTLIENTNTSKLPVFILLSPQNRMVRGYRNTVQIYNAIDSVMDEETKAGRNRKPDPKKKTSSKSVKTEKKKEPRKLIF